MEASLPSVRDARVVVWVADSAESWVRRSLRSASACSSRVSGLGVSAMSGAETGGSAAEALPGGDCGDWSSAGSAELHHQPIFQMMI